LPFKKRLEQEKGLPSKEIKIAAILCLHCFIAAADQLNGTH